MGFYSEGSKTMGRQSGTVREDKTEIYASQWFASIAKLHRVTNPATWEFTEEHLIVFFRYKVKQNMPTWKRLKAVEGNIWYRNNVRKSSTPRLKMVRAKLQEMVTKEKEPKGEVSIDDVMGTEATDVSVHLTDLAVDGDVAPSTQDQSLYALLFLFQHVLERDFGKVDAFRSTKAARIPIVMIKAEINNGTMVAHPSVPCP